MDHLKKLFPSATLSNLKTDNKGYVNIPRTDGTWLVIEEKDLTDREKLLVECLDLLENQVEPDSPWYRFLVKNQGSAPNPLKLIQFLHVKVIRHSEQNDLEAEWLDIFSQLLPNLRSHIKLSQRDFLFILDQELHFDSEAILMEILAILEFDFGMKITALIGQIWPLSLVNSWAKAYQLENELFQHLLEQPGFVGLNRFSLALLSTSLDITADLFQMLVALIAEHDEIEETIRTMWQEQAVITKTAQNLFIHRNTLQHRLDRFQEQTGLSLKRMDDLTICYLALLRQTR
ncbi:helix-turn-helix domain-containing protein [Streptococcus merionis]|uniref:Regulator of polyketide synthase expression n=1 Tax=Streptococcus merionis TaxID=400065 RepID=A0A239SPB1_9STRE|nr:helix-turn-helix domain-containing protein [Streptococcus merionis]SNU87240.1 regulator of polyketide synthase expression [Streptococcus merionis]